jgi:hypothetical protein
VPSTEIPRATLPGTTSIYFSLIATASNFPSLSEIGAMDRKLSAILAADVVGCSALMEADSPGNILN